MSVQTAPAACAACFETANGYEPDMGDDVTFEPGACGTCGTADVIVFTEA